MKRVALEEALDFFKAKRLVPSANWTDWWQSQHDHAFTMAGAHQEALLASVKSALEQSFENGERYEDFLAKFRDLPEVQQWGLGKNLGWRSRVIYDTNLQQSLNAGAYARRMELKALRPFWKYVHTTERNFRKLHKAWNGLILSADDPWWDTHSPQNGWGCKCRIDSLTPEEASAEWQTAGKNGPDKAPEIVWEERTVGSKTNHPRTVKVPEGIDPGFDYNPGADRLRPYTPTNEEALDGWRRGSEYAVKTDLPLPKPTVVKAETLINKEATVEEKLARFMSYFSDAVSEENPLSTTVVFKDKTGMGLVISDKLFKTTDGTLKWIAMPEKSGRLNSVDLLAQTIIDPDEIWWGWERVRGDKQPAGWVLRRTHLKLFSLENGPEYGISAFAWDGKQWSGVTTFLADSATKEKQLEYFNSQRAGRLVFQKK